VLAVLDRLDEHPGHCRPDGSGPEILQHGGSRTDEHRPAGDVARVESILEHVDEREDPDRRLDAPEVDRTRAGAGRLGRLTEGDLEGRSRHRGRRAALELDGVECATHRSIGIERNRGARDPRRGPLELGNRKARQLDLAHTLDELELPVRPEHDPTGGAKRLGEVGVQGGVAR
jgi:hypothetical protein